MDLAKLKDQIHSICDESGIAMLGVFGSVARGEDRPESDIDLIVRFKRPVGLIDLIRLEDRFEKTIGRKVDLGVEGSLHPLITGRVMKDVKILMKPDRDTIFLFDILECCKKIAAYIDGVSETNFKENAMLQDAVVRNIEIIGEAAKGLSEKVRDEIRRSRGARSCE
jgi:uncharacterized protein